MLVQLCKQFLVHGRWAFIIYASLRVQMLLCQLHPEFASTEGLCYVSAAFDVASRGRVDFRLVQLVATSAGLRRTIVIFQLDH